MNKPVSATDHRHIFYRENAFKNKHIPSNSVSTNRSPLRGFFGRYHFHSRGWTSTYDSWAFTV